MLVLFTGKSRASCRFLHSYAQPPLRSAALGIYLTELEGRPKSCIFSELEWYARFRARRVL
jgi:hypothetical protein